MKDQFVTYEIAAKMKELGFKDECIGYFGADGILKPLGQNFGTEFYASTLKNDADKRMASAPLWQQAFDWLREKYGLFISIEPIGHNVTMFTYEIMKKDNSLPSIIDEKYSSYLGELEPTYEETRKYSILKALELINKE